ncbi:DUF6517 family protein [Halohasta litorea]|uniref:DUF6517 family protein n=1 Tax=Halohasta litorea TaxID=869891 RepID=A0ABD6D7G6_9EURY|nr:DUF6517 family protein [Halohasta litorea]MEA1931218.1 DUF6517 family protein [Euryarchaeota archaeon]
MDRRRALTLIGTVGLTGVAGCLGEDGEITAAAAPAVITTADQLGYEADGPEELSIDETIEVGGVERDIRVTTYSAAYTDSDDQSSVFLFSTPDASVAGISVNPLARLSGADLIARLVDEGLAQTEGDFAVSEIEQEDEVTLSILGAERTVPIFSAVVEAEGSENPQIEGAENGEIPVRLYLLSTTHQEDVLLAIGIHPESIDASEDIQALLEGIEHPVGPTSETNETT